MLTIFKSLHGIIGIKGWLIVLVLFGGSLFGIYYNWKQKIIQEEHNKIQQESIEALNEQYQLVNTAQIAYQESYDAITKQGQGDRQRLGEISSSDQVSSNYLDTISPNVISQFLREATR